MTTKKPRIPRTIFINSVALLIASIANPVMSQTFINESSQPSFGAATNTVIDFQSTPTGQISSGTLSTGGVTFDNFTGGFNWNGSAVQRGLVSSATDNFSGRNFSTGMRVTFDNPTASFAFQLIFADNDWSLRAYSASGTLLADGILPRQQSNYYGFTTSGTKYFLLNNNNTNALVSAFPDSNDYVIFDNLVFISGPTGPSAADTQSSMGFSAQSLKGIYNLQSAALINSLSYDCQVFDKNNICLSTGGRYSNNHGASGYTTSALLIGAYRLNKNVRVGAWVDQNLSASSATGVQLGNSKPLFGVFGAWAENPTGEGYEVKVAAGYGDKDLTVTRDVIGTSEAGVGTSRLNSQAISSVSSYGFRLNNQLLASPYVGIRYSKIASNGYTEASSVAVTAPLTYNRLSQENVALMAGLRISAKLDPKTTLVASAGIEQNLKNRSGQYSASGVDGLTPIDFNSNPQETRATASLGAFYDIDKKQRVGVNGIYREETFKSTATTAVLATYTVGF